MLQQEDVLPFPRMGHEVSRTVCNIESCLRVIESFNLGASAITNVYILEE